MSANKMLKIVFLLVVVAFLSVFTAYALIYNTDCIAAAVMLICLAFALLIVGVIMNILYYKCSVCHKWLGMKRCKTCRHCGAKVD